MWDREEIKKGVEKMVALADFEHIFEGQILVRGLQYYEDGHVAELMQINATNWQAEVSGSELYIVDVVLDAAQNITYTDCDCPYEGDCKHIAAVLYALDEKYSGKPQFQPNLTLQEQLQQQTKEQLIALILKLSSQPTIETELALALHSHGNEREVAYRLITQHRQAAADRKGFIAWGQGSQAIIGIDLVHERIEEHIEAGRTELAVELALLCVYQGMDMLECGDDSTGELGGAVEASINLVDKVIHQARTLTDEQGLNILCQIEDALEDDMLNGWSDWQVDLLQACLPLGQYPRCEQQILRMMHMLGQQHQEGWSGSYVQTHLQKMKEQLDKAASKR